LPAIKENHESYSRAADRRAGSDGTDRKIAGKLLLIP
jgi:hypothetical protein